MARPTSDDRLSLTAAPMSCASGRRGVCILRAPGGPVDLDRHPAGGGPRFDQFERTVPAGVREQPRALADDHGIREQGDLVDQLLVDEPADKLAAAVHLQLTRRLGFQLADGRRTVTGEDGRVGPARFGERGRGHVLGLRVQRRPDRAVTRIWPHSPGAGGDLVGPPAEQERVGALEDPVEERIGLVDEQRRGPSAALESAPAVLVRPDESLHHSIDGNVRDGRQLHGFLLSLLGASPPFFDRFGLVYAARLQQQGRRFPLFIFEILTSTRRLRVSGFGCIDPANPFPARHYGLPAASSESLLGGQSGDLTADISLRSTVTRRPFSSRISRTSSTLLPAGSGSSQSRYRLPG